MEIIRVTNGDYAAYEELLLQREQLEKEADEYQREYICEFGQLITEVFKEKIECISLKKAIAFCQAAKNRGAEIKQNELEDYLNAHMAAYYAQLQNMLAQNKAANSGTPITDYQAGQIKKIYRRLAKLLHPDISPLTTQYPRLSELFGEIITAYKCNQLKRLQELEVLVMKALDEIGAEHADIVIDDIETKIEALEEEIHSIVTTEPYTYKTLLADAFAAAEKKKALEEELEEYKNYHVRLQKILDELNA